MSKNLSSALKTDCALVEEKLDSLLVCENEGCARLFESMRYSLFTGGKRVRPFLAVEFCRMFGGSVPASVTLGSALEMIHTYSLIHDDLPCMDNDDFRRGKPTNHKVFGEATAVLAGDALLTRAFSAAASADELSAECRLDAVSLLSELAGGNGMCGGQILDLEGESRALPKEEFLTMNALKTGCLIRCGCLLGCLSAGYRKGTPEYEAADSFGRSAGLAFQIEDDLLDGDEDEVKTTFLTFMTAEEAKAEIIRLTDEAKSKIKRFENNAVLTEFADWLAERTV